MSKSYNQYCPIAKALDLVGDRWSLLIVRELLIRGPSRYTDVRNGLPGIATNLLAGRLRELERAGLVKKEEAPPPIATTLFDLTERGQALEPVLLQLGAWGSPLLATARRSYGPMPHWLVLLLRLHFAGSVPGASRARIEIRADGVPITLDLKGGKVSIVLGPSRAADARITGDAATVLEFMTGRLPRVRAQRRGLRLAGDLSAIRRIVPRCTRKGLPASR